MPDLPFLDSFDHYLTADGMQKWTTGVNIGAGLGRRGTAGAVVAGTGISKTFDAEYGVLYAGGAFKCPGNSPFKFDNVLSRIELRMQCVGDGRFIVAGSDPTDPSWFPVWPFTGVTPPILNDRWYYLEMMAQVTPSSYSAILRINEEVVLNETHSLVGRIETHAAWAQLSVQGRGGGVDTWVDDFYVDNAGFFGDVSIDVIRPNGPYTSQWTPNPTRDNWQNVNDLLPDGDETVVSSAHVNDLDLYTMEDIPSGLTVKAIQGIASVRKDHAGLAALKLQYGAAGSALLSDEFFPGAEYTMIRDGRKDFTTASAINALTFGQIRTQ